jgi:predicted nucleic acid-binding protein
MTTSDRISGIVVLDVTGGVGSEWARLRVHLVERGRRVSVNDLWIAAGAVARGLPIVTQDDDFDPLDGVRGLVVVHV